MKGIAGKQTRGLPTGAQLVCADNTGAKVVEIIQVLNIHTTARQYPTAGVGDMVIVSVKKGTPDMRKKVFPAVIIRQRMPFRRPDGTMVQFEDNACVITTKTGETKGSEIKGPVAREAADRWPRIAAISSTIV